MLPVLYTFRRCPYAMRARWAILVSGVQVQMHEVSLRDKPAAMLEASPKGTVPVLVLADGRVIDQSLDIMLWALEQSDPGQWLSPGGGALAEMLELIDSCELDFKPHLDRYKYPSRYKAEWLALDEVHSVSANRSQQEQEQEQNFSEVHFSAALRFLKQLSERLKMAPSLSGVRPALADFAIVVFIRQMARHDPVKFEEAVERPLVDWMNVLLAKDDFADIMRRSVSS